jgi:hypothetical protein
MKFGMFLNPALTIQCIKRRIQNVINTVSGHAVPDLITVQKREGLEVVGY